MVDCHKYINRMIHFCGNEKQKTNYSKCVDQKPVPIKHPHNMFI